MSKPVVQDVVEGVPVSYVALKGPLQPKHSTAL